MSSAWNWFVIIGSVGSLIGALWLLFANRKVSGKETTGHTHDGIEELDNPLPMWWVGMFVISVIFAGAYLIWFPGLGNFQGVAKWTSLEQWQAEVDRHDERFAPLYQRLAALSPDQLTGDRTAMQVGRRLFINHCATCHGVGAQGAFGFPNLTDGEWIWGEGFGNIKTAILHGRNAVMPGWGAALGDDGVADVTQYTLKLAGRDHDAAAAERGAGHYAMLCVACHGADGGGNPALGAPQLTNDLWLYGRDPEQIAFTIRHGRNGNMPAFGDIIGENKAHVLAGYIYSLTAEPATTGD